MAVFCWGGNWTSYGPVTLDTLATGAAISLAQPILFVRSSDMPYGGTINLTRAVVFKGANQNKCFDCYNDTLPLGPKPILYGLPVGTTTAGMSQCYFHHSRPQSKQTLVRR